jgi:hypothetical protein
MVNDPIFVIGIGRSGTTLLRLMLHHHPRIAIPYESEFLTRHYEAVEKYGDLRDDANLAALVDAMLAEPALLRWDHTFDRSAILANLEERTVAGVSHAIYSQYAAAKGKGRWGDKSDYLDQIHLLNEMFPRSQFIHIIRDGRDVAASVMKLSWGPNDIISAAQWWNDHLWVARRVGAVLGKERYLEIRYENLVEEPERELRRCCAFLHEEYSPEMLAYHLDSDAAIPPERRAQHHGYNAPPDRSRIYAWKREMHPCDIALFDRYAGRMLAEVGYELPPVSCGRVALGWRLISILLRRAVQTDRTKI